MYRIAKVLHEMNMIEKIKKKFIQMYEIFIEEFDDSVFIDKILSIQDRITNDYIPTIRESAKITYANSLVFLERIQRIVTKVVDLNPAEEIDIDEWKVCTLLDREDISPKYSRYRFELLNPDGVLPLNIGQELTMCVIDDEDRVLKESFFPISTQNSKGYFDVVVKNENDYAGNIDENSFASTLKELRVGDELAFKGGRYRLNYSGKQKKITALTCVAAGVGITPILQVLRGVLPESESSIGDVELLWMNENGEEFLCDDEISKFEVKYYSKFFASKVVQPDLYGVNMMKNDDILGSISPYEPGRIAVIAGPDYVITKARQLLTTIGYPSDCILSILQ